ncbi:MAG: hypothetical protein J6O03_04950 [Butyrivibrio sp.]|nr:hypothetical protein [Butyrivibrio sp.]
MMKVLNVIKGIVLGLVRKVNKTFWDSLFVIAANVWIATFSLRVASLNEEQMSIMPITILIGIIILLLTCVVDIIHDPNRMENPYKKGEWPPFLEPHFKNARSVVGVLLCTLIFLVLLIVPLLVSKVYNYIIVLYLVALILAAVGVVLYNNDLINRLFKIFLLNFGCPLFAFYICVQYVVSFPSVLKGGKYQDAFAGFAFSFANLLINSLYILAIILIVYLSLTIVGWLKFGEALSRIRSEHKKEEKSCHSSQQKLT